MTGEMGLSAEEDVRAKVYINTHRVRSVVYDSVIKSFNGI